MVCIGVPTLRPLYLKTRGLTLGSGYGRHQSQEASTLPRFEIIEKGTGHKRIIGGSISSPVLLSTTNLAANYMTPIHGSIQHSKLGSPPRLSESSFAPMPPPPARLSASPRSSIDHGFGLVTTSIVQHPLAVSSNLPPRSDSLRSHIVRPATSSSSRSGSEGVIWVRNEVIVEKGAAPQWPLRA